MTDDAIAVTDALGWDSAHLFGHSMGGQVAQRTALRHPGRVRSLTSSASLPGDAGRMAAGRYVHLGLVARLARMKFPEGRDGDIALAVAATRAIASAAHPVDEQAVRRMAARDQVSGVRDAAAQSRQAGANWHGGRLSRLRVPALVQAGPHGIRANCIAPETILTDRNGQLIPAAQQASWAEFHPLNRLGTPADVAAAAAFLASDAAAWITGVVLDIAGGSVMT
jgi:pimeloyl-ACP methyl ester carboxylesterase